MSFEISYHNGSMDGKTKRVRSLGEQLRTRTFIWREYDKRTRQATGRMRREVYLFDSKARRYSLIVSEGICDPTSA